MDSSFVTKIRYTSKLPTLHLFVVTCFYRKYNVSSLNFIANCHAPESYENRSFNLT